MSHETIEFIAQYIAPFVMGGMLMCLPLFLNNISK